jgi:hypothetical protein
MMKVDTNEACGRHGTATSLHCWKVPLYQKRKEETNKQTPWLLVRKLIIPYKLRDF